jgi:Fe-S cluster biogenesis protein NfuA
MFIQTEDTPNPATMKFLPSRLVVDNPVDFDSPAKAAVSPLAQSLFAIEGVRGVFLGTDFISVTRHEKVEWPLLRPAILEAIMNHFIAERPVLEEGEAVSSSPETPEEDKAVVAQIKELLNTRIRPAVAQDGGDVAFERYENGVVYLRLKGACSGCPSATATLKYGIENMLRHFIPEVQEVRRVI